MTLINRKKYPVCLSEYWVLLRHQFFPKMICTLNTVPFKIPGILFVWTDKLVVKFIQKYKWREEVGEKRKGMVGGRRGRGRERGKGKREGPITWKRRTNMEN